MASAIYNFLVRASCDNVYSWAANKNSYASVDPARARSDNRHRYVLESVYEPRKRATCERQSSEQREYINKFACPHSINGHSRVNDTSMSDASIAHVNSICWETFAKIESAINLAESILIFGGKPAKWIRERRVKIGWCASACEWASRGASRRGAVPFDTQRRNISLESATAS